MKTHEFELAQWEGVCWEAENGPISVYVLDFDKETNEVSLGIDGPLDFKIELSGHVREIWGTPKCKGIPRFWLLFSLVLSHRVRREIFMPTFNEFVEDYFFARQKIRRKWERRWIAVAFTLRTMAMVSSCLRIQFCGQLATAFGWLCKVASRWK